MASFFIRKKDLEFIKSFNYCKYCGSIDSLVIDHIYPRNKGGSNNINNLTRACNRCNVHKSDFTITQFLYRYIDKREECSKIIISCINIISRHKNRGTPIISKYANVYNTLKIEREKHSYYSKVIGNIINEKYKIQ